MIPERAGILRHKIIGERLARPDRILGQMRHTVHRIGNTQAVPMNGSVLRKAIVERDAQTLSLPDADFRRCHLAVVGPYVDPTLRIAEERHSRGRCEQTHIDRSADRRSRHHAAATLHEQRRSASHGHRSATREKAAAAQLCNVHCHDLALSDQSTFVFQQ